MASTMPLPLPFLTKFNREASWSSVNERNLQDGKIFRKLMDGFYNASANIYRMGVRNSWNGMSIYEGFLTMDLWCNGDGKKRRRKTRCNSGKIA